MINEFKKFILRGNAVDLAVGIVIGAAFTSIVNSLVKGLITPLITIFYNGYSFNQVFFTVRGQKFLYGEFLNNLITFLIVAAVVFFLVVQPINKIKEVALGSKKSETSSARKCPYCLSEIPKAATRCAHCTSKLKAEA